MRINLSFMLLMVLMVGAIASFSLGKFIFAVIVLALFILLLGLICTD